MGKKSVPMVDVMEENHTREAKPLEWKDVDQGLEFRSYAMALGRRWNVERGKLFDTFCYEWIDANETKETSFTIAMKHCCDGDEAAGFKRRSSAKANNNNYYHTFNKHHSKKA